MGCVASRPSIMQIQAEIVQPLVEHINPRLQYAKQRIQHDITQSYRLISQLVHDKQYQLSTCINISHEKNMKLHETMIPNTWRTWRKGGISWLFASLRSEQLLWCMLQGSCWAVLMPSSLCRLQVLSLHFQEVFRHFLDKIFTATFG